MRRVAERVPMEICKRRARTALDIAPQPASQIAQSIWPGTKWKGQGAGGAASRVLKAMEKDGLARWVCRTADSGDKRWGWVL